MLQRCSRAPPPSPGPNPRPGPPLPSLDARLPLATVPALGITGPKSTSARLAPASAAASIIAPGVA